MKQASSSLTIVIPHFNHGHLIGNQLASIFAQTVQPDRIIILDDASTDNSFSIIEGLISSRPNVDLVRKEKNSGPLVAANEGLGSATTDYVCFLAADDIVLPTFFEKSLALLARYPQAALCSAVSYVEHASGTWRWPAWLEYPTSAAAFIPPKRVLELFLSYENWIVCNTTIYRRDLLVAAGGFDPQLRSFADGFLCRVLALKHGACFVPEPLTVFRLSDAGYSISDALSEERSTAILEYSNYLMRTNYPELFPAKLIARNNARMMYRLLRVKLNNLPQSVQIVVERTQPMIGSGQLLFVVRWTARILRLLVLAGLCFHDIPHRVLIKIGRKVWPSPSIRK